LLALLIVLGFGGWDGGLLLALLLLVRQVFVIARVLAVGSLLAR
jgi:hypothetical protein